VIARSRDAELLTTGPKQEEDPLSDLTEGRRARSATGLFTLSVLMESAREDRSETKDWIPVEIHR
jgi:hypothetical protein